MAQTLERTEIVPREDSRQGGISFLGFSGLQGEFRTHSRTGSNSVRLLQALLIEQGTTTWSVGEPLEPTEHVDQRPVSARVNHIRTVFGLSVKDLAAVLNVERPTVYAWMRDGAKLQEHNALRLNQVLDLADEWKSCAEPSAQPPMDGPTEDNQSLLDALSMAEIDSPAIKRYLRDTARRTQTTAMTGLLEGVAKSIIDDRPAWEFNVATNRRLGAED